MITPVRILYQCVEFAIRESTRTAFSKLNIRIRIQDTVFPETIYRFFTFLSFLPTFQNKRTITGLCQIPCAEKACRSTSDHDRCMFQHLCSRLRKTIWLFIS